MCSPGIPSRDENALLELEKMVDLDMPANAAALPARRRGLRESYVL